jgi:phage-related protein
VRYFETQFLEEAEEFLSKLSSKTIRKVLYNIELSEQTKDPRLFKKLQDDIWEFRARYDGLQIRFLAFWDKSDERYTLVIACNGYIKKANKTDVQEIEKAKRLREQYFNYK